ncbi:MAG: glycosyltransferase family 1 protein [Bacteroidales bacterium]|nr:glycosyltransferase family 1 protein [Bacteroidales bacterium]
MKKILIDLNKLSNLNCGLGQVALNFGKTLSEVETNLELNYLLPNEYVGFFGDKINYYTSKTIAAARNKFDLWHCIHQEPVILPDDDTKLLITIHDLNFLGEKNDRKAANRLKKLQNLVNRADKLAFISEFSKKVALDNLKYHRDKTSVIFNGVNTSSSEQKPEIYSEKFFFTIGVFKPKKNFHVLIPVMKHFPDYKLIIAGDAKGSYYKELKKLAKKENLEEQILFPGIISEQEKTWYYRNCKAFLFPSLYEGFGLPVIEAMQNAVPVVTSDKTVMPEVGGGFTFIFKDFDENTIKTTIEKAILKYQNDIEFKLDAVKYAQEYTWERNVTEYLQIYDK